MVLKSVGQTREDLLQCLRITFVFSSLLENSEPHGLKESWPYRHQKLVMVQEPIFSAS